MKMEDGTESEKPARSVDDLLCLLGGCAAFVWAGFETSRVHGLCVLGACLVGTPLLFSWLLPMIRVVLQRRKAQ